MRRPRISNDTYRSECRACVSLGLLHCIGKSEQSLRFVHALPLDRAARFRNREAELPKLQFAFGKPAVIKDLGCGT